MVMISSFLRVLCVVSVAAVSSSSFSDKHLIQPVPLQDVRLQYNSQFDKAVSLNKEYLLGLDSDRLLKTFRLNAGLDAPGESFSGSWEDPGCEVRGQYMGHWLSGTAVLGKNSGDKALLEKADSVVKELRKVQQKIGSGYLSAFPTEHFERLRNLQGVWAPFYVIHKIMAGLLDQYLFLGNSLALRMVEEEAEFFHGFIEDILGKEGEQHWLQMLENEYGGMEEVLFNLYDVTKNATWAKMAKRFTKPNFFEPLTKDVDVLPNRHANTHLAQVNGYAAGFEKTGDKDRLVATYNFFDIVLGGHSYATGGNNDGEFWQAPHEMGPTVYPDGSGLNTEETCTTYNMMKISRYLFRWSGEARFADYYEKAILNGFLGTQRMPADYQSITQAASRVSPIVSDDHDRTGRRLLDANNPHLRAHTAGFVPQTVSRFSSNETDVLQAQQRRMNWRAQAFQQGLGANHGLADPGNEPGPGVIIYLLPLGSGNTKDDSFHHWSTPLNSFWCCSGSTSEQFGKLMDSIYFERDTKGAPELYVNQLTPSSLEWKLGGLNLTLEADLHAPDNVARASILFGSATGAEGNGSREAVLKLRIPGWLVPGGGSVSLNAGEVKADGSDLKPGSYLALKRAFKSGDKIEIAFPMTITTKPIDDWRPEYRQLQAVYVGPFLLAALTDKERTIQADAADIARLVHRVDNSGLVSFEVADGAMLSQAAGALERNTRCLSRMDCTFRLSERRRDVGNGLTPLASPEALRTGAEFVIESMTQPSHFLVENSEGALVFEARQPSSAPSWRFGAAEDGLTLAASDGRLVTTSATGLGLAAPASAAFAEASEALVVRVRNALGAYPDGARLLKGEDRSYVIAPIGNLVEERYSPYLEFAAPARGVTSRLDALMFAS